MKLFKVETAKCDKFFVDYYLGWVYEAKAYLVRVKPTFKNDMPMLFVQAEEMPTKKACISALLG